MKVKIESVAQKLWGYIAVEVYASVEIRRFKVVIYDVVRTFIYVSAKLSVCEGIS